MRLIPEYLISGLFLILGILTLIFKPYYEPDKRINLKKASIYQGWSMIVFSLYLLVLKIFLNILRISGWWPLGLVFGLIVLLVIILRLKKACFIKDESENETFNRGIYQWKSEIAKKICVGFAFAFTIFLFTSMLLRPKISLVDNKFKVSGGFGFEYPVTDIVQADTVDGYPHVELMLGGSGFGGIYKGTFKLEAYGKGRLFLKKSVRPFIYIRFRNNDFVFFNLKSKKSTVDFYNDLMNMLK